MFFRECIVRSKEAYRTLNEQLVGHKCENSLDIEIHISWDFAEQVHLPFSSQQVVITVIITLIKWINLITKKFRPANLLTIH